MTGCTVLAAAGRCALAADLSVTISGKDGAGVAGVVVIAEPAVPAPRAAAAGRAELDQRDLQFMPEVLVVRTGTAVAFPNSDQVRHQVYSFSPAKVFQLPLYAGRTQAPVVFDKPGLVTLGCNIHDNMVGYIYVTDSPWYGRSGADGTLRLRELPPGGYLLRIWHPRLDESGPQLEQRITLAEGGNGSLRFQLRRALRPAPAHHGTNKKWADY